MQNVSAEISLYKCLRFQNNEVNILSEGLKTQPLER